MLAIEFRDTFISIVLITRPTPLLSYHPIRVIVRRREEKKSKGEEKRHL